MQSLNTDLLIGCTKTGRRKYFFSQYFVLFTLLIFCMYQYGIHRIYGFSIYPDEFGYWASAAKWIGIDWSDVTALGYYYSFGYSLILAPLLKLFRDGVTAYRAAVTVNVLLQCVSIGLLYGIFRRVYSSMDYRRESTYEKEMPVIFAVGAAVFYPVWSFYTQMTLAEALLTFLYLFICWQFTVFFERPGIINGMLLSIAFVYVHFVHMRTVGVVAAAVLTMILYAWKKPGCRKVFFTGTAVLIVGIWIGLWVKNMVTGTVYDTATAEQLAVNDYAGQLGRLKTIFTIQEMLYLLESCVGKLYYLGLASFGLFYPAMAVCIKKTAKLLTAIWKKTEEKNETETKIFQQDWIYLFLLFSMTGQFLVSSIYMSHPGRLDGIVYGRYNDYLLPVFIGVGILALFENRHLFRNFLISAGISTILSGITLWNALHSELTVMQGYFSAGISYLSDDVDYRIIPEFVKAYLLGILLMAIIAGCIYICRRFQKNVIAAGILLLMETALTLCLSEKYTYFFNDVDYFDLRIYEYIENFETETMSEASVSYLYGDGLPYIDLIQFVMREKTVAIIRESDITDPVRQTGLQSMQDTLQEKGFLIADNDSGFLTELEATYRKCMESENFVLFLIE